MSIDYAVLGQRIKQARLAKKMTQETLSEKLDVSVAFLSRVERGTSHINLLRLTQISFPKTFPTFMVSSKIRSKNMSYFIACSNVGA